MNKISYTKPSIGDLELEYVIDAVTNGWGAKCYDYINDFEAHFCDYLGVNYAIATSSCTGALHMGLHALGIGKDDEVIIPDTSWIATAAPIIHLGAIPVLVDVLEDTWCINPRQVEASITEKTKAIIAVHLYGNLCNMRELLQLGEKYNIPVIEDSAEAIGSSYFGKKAGSLGTFGTFSFHGTKTMTTGEGGMFVTNDQGLYEHVLTLSNHGRSRYQAKQFWPDMIGFKYKISNVQAAIGCAQLQRINSLVEQKRNIFKLYKEHLKPALHLLRMNPEPESTINGYWMPTVSYSENDAFYIDELFDSFAAHNIDARVFFWPLSLTPAAQYCVCKDTPISNEKYKTSLNLPSPYDITEKQVALVSEILLSHPPIASKLIS